MRASIIAVGTELLFGQTVNTNAAYISKELQDLSVDVMYHYTVGDNPQRLKETIELALRDCDLIVTTGGLGPTQDDLTKEVVCETFGINLILDEKHLVWMREHFKKLGREMTKNNEKQCYVPEEGIVLNNDRGTAPGFIIEKEGKMAIALPGPPREMKNMFQTGARPILEEKQENVLYYKVVRTIGIGESALETNILDIIENSGNSTIATYAKEGECTLRVASKMPTKEEAIIEVDKTIKRIDDRIGKFIYSLDDQDLKDVVINKLLERNITVSVAESCTGGKFAATLVEIDGISQIFDRGLVTYSNKSKVEELGVKEETLEKFGAVSEETAREMVEGLREKAKSDLCISVTGIAGPEGGTEEKPVGTVHMAATYKGMTHHKEILLINTGRNGIRNNATLQMFNLVNKVIG